MDANLVNSLQCANAERSYTDLLIKYYGIQSCKEDLSELDYRENILMIDLYQSGYSCETINKPCP